MIAAHEVPLCGGGEGSAEGTAGDEGGSDGDGEWQSSTSANSITSPVEMAVVGSSLIVLKSVVPMVSLLVRATLLAPAGTVKRHQLCE